MRSRPLFTLVLLLAISFSAWSPAGLATAQAQQTAPRAAVAEAAKEADAKQDEAQRKEDEEYYELLKLFVDTLDQVDRNYVKELSRRELMEAAIRGVLEKLDPYSNYIPPKELERFRTGVENEFGGIGIQVTIENNQLTIISPIVGSPAYRAGVMAGDVITEIEGVSTKGITIDEAIKKLKGKAGTKVAFTVLHPHDKSTEKVALEREIVKVESVLGDRRGKDDAWEYMYDETNKIGFIRITAFSRDTADNLRSALEELTKEGMKGLVLDLRFNPGGLLTAAVEICDMFVSDGVIVSTKGRNTPERVMRAHKEGTFEGFPIAILVNNYSASASEIVSACLQDHKRAVVIGERTWGKGSVQNIITLEQGKSALKLTTASYHRPSGKNIHKFEGATDKDEWGVMPSDGYAIKLNPTDLSRLLSDRRQRDIVVSDKQPQPHSTDDPFVDRQRMAAIEYLAEELKNPAIVSAETHRQQRELFEVEKARLEKQRAEVEEQTKKLAEEREQLNKDRAEVEKLRQELSKDDKQSSNKPSPGDKKSSDDKKQAAGEQK